MVKYVTTYQGMHLTVFLVADEEKRGWLVNYQIEDDDFGYMCPCCMFPRHRQAIMEAIKAALRDDAIQGKIRSLKVKFIFREGIKIKSNRTIGGRVAIINCIIWLTPWVTFG